MGAVLSGLRTLVQVALALAGLLAVIVWALQDWLLYVPRIPGVIHNRDPAQNEDRSQRSPSFYGLRFESALIETRTKGVRIHVWVVFRGRAKALDMGGKDAAPTIVFFHGNAGNIGHRLPFVDDVVQYARCNVVLVEYRGYGKSSGWPSESGLLEDAHCVMEYLAGRRDVDPSRTFLMGRSLGGAVALALAADLSKRRVPLPFRGLVLENTFLSVKEVVRDRIETMLPMSGLANELARAVVWLDWNSGKRARQLPVDLPVLFLSGDDDEIIPSGQMLDLYMQCTSREKQFVSIAHGDHNFTWCRPGYFEALREFVDTADPPPQDPHVQSRRSSAGSARSSRTRATDAASEAADEEEDGRGEEAAGTAAGAAAAASDGTR